MKTIRRNHTGHRVGEDHQRAALTDEQVRAIRAKHRPHMRAKHRPHMRGFGYGALAKEFGCGESTVRDICTYRTRASA